jgi:hypothetical protein
VVVVADTLVWGLVMATQQPPLPGSLEDTLGTFIDDRVHTAVVNAMHELLGDEGTLMLPFTAWMNGWFTQLRTDYSPGGVFAEAMKEAVKNFHLFLHDNPPPQLHEEPIG